MIEKDAILLIARICLAVVFLYSGVHKALYFKLAQQEFRQAKIPQPDISLVLVIALHLMASLGLIAGIHAGLCASALAVFMVVVTLWVQDFWNQSGEMRLASSRAATANLAIFGGLLLAATFGPGKYILV